MFDFSWGELLVVGAVALVAIGPKELPGVLRTVGQWMTKMRRLAAEFQGQFHEAIREAEMADLKKEVDEMTEKAKSYTNFDPIGDIQKDIESTMADKPAEPPSPAVSSAPLTTDELAPTSQSETPAPAAPAVAEGALQERHDGVPDAGAKPA
jgi:sec-independent protein translocase protein TatB